MLFALKSPLKRRLTPEDLHQSREALENGSSMKDQAFIGASLYDKTGCTLDLKSPTIYRMSGDKDTHAADVILGILREVVEKESVLLLDFTGVQDYWHKFWALSFYYDRAKAFRLYDLSQKERSDLLGDFVPSDLPQHLKAIASYLGEDDHASNPKIHLEKGKGLVAFYSGDKEQELRRELLWELSKHLMATPDHLVIFGWNQLKSAQKEEVLKARETKSPSPHLYLVQDHVDPKDKTQGYIDLLFRQRNPLPEKLWQHINLLSKGGPGAKVLSKMSQDLNPFKPDQCFGLLGSGTDSKLALLQITSGDGLPWPPEYRPLRSRHPGT